MTRYRLAPRALADLKSISADTQREWGRQQRLKYQDDLEDCFKSLAQMPDIGRDVSHIRKGFRAYPKGSHVIYYIQEGGGIAVARILNQSQSTMRAFSRLTKPE